MIDVEQIKREATGKWLGIFESLAIDVPLPAGKRHSACPICRAGKDRFRLFEDSAEKGGWWCNQCSPNTGDGWSLIQLTLGNHPQQNRRQRLPPIPNRPMEQSQTPIRLRPRVLLPPLQRHLDSPPKHSLFRKVLVLRNQTRHGGHDRKNHGQGRQAYRHPQNISGRPQESRHRRTQEANQYRKETRRVTDCCVQGCFGYRGGYRNGHFSSTNLRYTYLVSPKRHSNGII
ncbi:MAG: hypothetical protein UU99_C0011G0001 [Parcubacteria group bacterium GW2011_GWE2_42_14]|nr:MAG: hypothetical protein UU99_C0011G0001 [Parcubacteria group bacterium GW2011_GWE2_42_14]